MKQRHQFSARLGLTAAALMHLALQSGCGDDGEDPSTDLEITQVVFDEEQKTLRAVLSRPLAEADREAVYITARRGWFGSADCQSIAAAAAPAAATTVGGQDAALSAPVADDLLVPFYGTAWDAPTAEMIAAAQAGTDAVVTVCALRGNDVLVAQELDLDRVRDDSRTGAPGEKSTGSASETPLHSTVRYAERCVAELGEIPFFPATDGTGYGTFDCLEATPIPVTVTEGETTENPAAPVDQCDRPQYAGGACEPGPRVATRINAEGTRWVLLCRGASEGYASAEYDDISLIGHNPETGKACFFQNGLHAKRNGSAIPHPADENTSHTVWSGVHGGIGSGRACVRCHDADPFIHTPWIDQALDDMGNPVVPRMGADPAYVMGALEAPYTLVNATGQGWSMPEMLAEPEVAACTQCHRIGTGIWLDWAKRLDGSDPDFRSRTTDAFLTFAALHWMPPGSYRVSEASWPSSAFAAALQTIKDCGQAPGTCQSTPLRSEQEAADAATVAAAAMGDEALATAALRALSASVPDAARRCSECHPVSNELLKSWRQKTEVALDSCLSFLRVPAPEVITEQGTLAKDQIRHFTPVDVPAGTKVSVLLQGSGDADLYTRWESAPNRREFDCRPFFKGSQERCESAGPGRLYVAVDGAADASDFTLTITSGAQTVAGTRVSQRELGSLARGERRELGPFQVAVGGSITASMTGTGNVDLTLRRGQEPQPAAYDCRSAVAGSDEHCQASGSGSYYVHIEAVASGDYTLQLAWIEPTDELQPQAVLDCLRSDPADPASGFVTDKLGIYAAAVHSNVFRDLFKALYPEDSAGWREPFQRFVQRVSMPRGAHPVLSAAELAAVTEWFRRGLPLIDVLLPRQEGEICEELDPTALAQHIAEMEISGWAARNRDSGMNMFGCPPNSQSPLDCLTAYPTAASQEYGQGWDIIPGSTQRILREILFTTSFWMRSSVDGRFLGNGASSFSAGAAVTDLQRRIDIPADAAYDPSFFPDNSGFLFQGTPVGTGVCSMSLLTEGPSQISFQESECRSASEISLYQHVAAGLGGDYYAISGQFVSDNGGHYYDTSGDPSAYFDSSSYVTITRMIFDGTGYYDAGSQSASTPNEGDAALSPSGRLVISRLAGVNGKAAGFVIRKVEITDTGAGFEVELPEIAKVCVEGAKASLSLDERYLITHHYVDQDDYADLGFASPDDPDFAPYLTRGAANVIVVDLLTGVRTRITAMQPGQYALFPHFRSDGWVYFLVRDANTGREFAVASDAVLLLGDAP